MEDMKSFLQSRLKNIKGTDMSKLIDICDISRAKFYKCLREPWYFSDTDLTRIANRMNLSDEERTELFDFKYDPDRQLSSDVDSGDTGYEDLYDYANKIIFRKKPVATDVSNRIFTLFRNEDNAKGNTACYSDELADMIWENINTSDMEDRLLSPQDSPIDILVINSLSELHRSYIFTLIRSLHERCPVAPLEANSLVSTTHYIDQTDEPDRSYIHYYSDWCALTQYGYYTMHFTDKLAHTFLKNWNGCLLSYTNLEGNCRHLLVSINAQDHVSIYSFTDQNLYRFLKFNLPNLQREEDFQRLLINSFTDTNPLLIDLAEKHPKITIDVDPCLTTIIDDLFTQMQAYITAPDTKWNKLDTLKSALGASELSEMFGDTQLINFLFDEFRRRFRAEEENDAINLISAAGLTKFVRKKQLPDMALVELSFNREQMIKQLEYYKENLGKADVTTSHQHYYIVMAKDFDLAMHIYKGRCALMAPHTNSAPLLYFRSVSDSESATILHDYVVNQLLSEESRSKHDSPVMSDEKAAQFIDGLIAELEKEPSPDIPHNTTDTKFL